MEIDINVLPSQRRILAGQQLAKWKTSAKLIYPKINDKIIAIEKRITIDNRNSKIESIIDNKEFIEQKIESDLEYLRLVKIKIVPLRRT